MAIQGLSIRTTAAASVKPTPSGGFLLKLPAGKDRKYRLAQLDDYSPYSRANFLWQEPITLSLRARLLAGNDLGTWGFGLWNDPFSLSFGVQGTARRLPALPNAAWFFFASQSNHLTLRDDRPGNGFLAATFSSPTFPTLLLAPALIGIPLLAWKWASRGLRSRLRDIVHGDSQTVEIDPSNWVYYALNWQHSRVIFSVDEKIIFETDVVPHGPLGLVIWMDNQYAAWRPDGALAVGALAGEGATMEIEDLQLLTSPSA